MDNDAKTLDNQESVLFENNIVEPKKHLNRSDNELELFDCKEQIFHPSPLSHKKIKNKPHKHDAVIDSKIETVSSSDNEDFYETLAESKRRRKSKKQYTKEKKICEVISSNPLDLDALRQLAIEEGGLINDDLRKKAWPQLMQVDKFELSPKPPLDEIKCHKDYTQVVLDVNRTLKRFPPGIEEDYRIVLMEQLTTLIIRVLTKHPHLNYYQGFHDVAITFLLVMGESVGFELVERLAVSHLHEFMKPTMQRTTYYLTYLYPILRRANDQLYQFLIDSHVGTVFCLPWLITWYAHTLSDYRNVVRLYDYLLASPYLMPMYIAAAIVLHRESHIMQGECDMAMQHYILSQVPDSLPFENLLQKAGELYLLYPPDDLRQEVESLLQKWVNEEKAERQRLKLKKAKQVAKKGSGNVIPWGGVFGYIGGLLPPRYQPQFKILLLSMFVGCASIIYAYYYRTYYFEGYWSGR